jgi:hypothetical protein
MIRIDENTYIDDTLVTCAEYQLFIEEMRWYCQPDHWSSCQFPVGQARAPVVGVRFEDARNFCEWLTKRETGDWRFRLPTMEEAERYPFRPTTQLLLGYWATGKNNDHQFAWIGTAPVNPRGIDINPSHDFGLNRTLNQISALDIDRDINLGISTTGELNSARQWAENSRNTRDSILDNALRHTRDLIISIIVDISRNRAGGNSGALDNYLYVYFDIVTLQERIAGRSPAFEGIRLVKERKP